MINSNSLRQRVKHLMSLDQRYRDNDHYVIMAIWAEEGLHLTKEQRAIFLGTTSPDDIVRRRREFSKLFPASKLVQDKRYSHYKKVTDEYSNQSWIKRLLHRRGIET